MGKSRCKEKLFGVERSYRRTMGNHSSRRSEKELTGPARYMYKNYGTNSTKFITTWVKITADDGLLKFPQSGTFDPTRLENLKEKLNFHRNKHLNKHFSSLRLWRDESRRRNAESEIALLTDQNKNLMTQLEETKKHNAEKIELNNQLDGFSRTTKTNKNDQIKNLYPVIEVK